jgi:electron transfer flavoprotein beta subunit
MTMLEDSNEIRRGTMADALRAARAEIVKWSAEDAGIPELAHCGLRGSPTIVKKVFAPTARAEKAQQIPVTDRSWTEMAADAMQAIFTRRPGLETDLLQRAEGYQ